MEVFIKSRNSRILKNFAKSGKIGNRPVIFQNVRVEGRLFDEGVITASRRIEGNGQNERNY